MVALSRMKKWISLCASLLVLCSAPVLYAQTYMFGQIQMAVGTQPQSIATGDFNNDGILDMAVANMSDNTVSVLLGKPNGTFAQQAAYATGSQPVSVAVGDFNGDGNLDLAVVDKNCAIETGSNPCGTGAVSILLGNGDGTFQPHIEYDTGTEPVWVEVGDLNGDGKLDMAVVNQNCIFENCNSNDGSGTVSVLLGNGDGTFQPQATYGTQTFPIAIVVADFNGDGKLDLGVAVRGCAGGCDGGLSVLLGNGDGTFQKHMDFNTQTPGSSIVAGDFNGDGKLDVAIGGSTNSILLGNGDGTFSYDGSYAGGNGTIFAVDLIGNGKLDLVSGGFVLLGNGDGTFQPAIQYGPDYGVSPLGANSSTLLDANGDGRLDLVMTTTECAYTPCSPGFVTILLGLGNGTFVGSTNFSAPGLYTGLITADFNGDGYLDLAGEDGYPATGISVLLGNGNGTFQPEISTSLSSVTGNLVAGSFKNPNEIDLATVVSTCSPSSCPPGNAAVLLGNGDGTFQAAVDYLVGAGPVALTVGDFNGDGNLDLAVSNSVSNTVSILLGNGDGTFRTHVDYPATAPGPIIAGDFNGDGKLDLAFASVNLGDPGGVGIMLGNGDGSFQAEVNYAVGVEPLSIAVADFRGNGKLDLAVGGEGITTGFTEFPEVSVLLGNGDGTFQPYVNYPSAVDAASPAVAVSVADFNGDGIPDLVSGVELSPNAAIMLGNGDGTFQSPLVYTLGTTSENAGAIAIGDFNGDSVPDIAWPNGVLLSIPFRAVSPTALNFGSQGVGTTGLAQVMTISNPTNVQFNLNSIAATGNFAETNNCGSTLTPGSNCTVNVTFSPTTTGLQQGAITITDTTKTSPQSIPLTGTGVSGSFLTASPSTVSFATQAVGTNSAALTVTLLNTGSASLSLSSVAIAGTNSSDFTQSNTCGNSLPTGANCVVNVTFAPSAAGTRTGQLTITDSAPGSPQAVNLVGTGLDFQISAASFSPGTVTAGGSSTSTVTIAPLNGFNSAVTLSCSGLTTGITCTFNPSLVTPSNGNATSALTVNTVAGLAGASYPISIVGTSGTSSHSASQSLIVQSAAPEFTISSASGSSSSATVSPGQSANFNLAVTPAFAFTATLDLTCSISPTVTPAPTCSVPGSLPLSGGTAGSVKVTVETTAPVTTGTAVLPSGRLGTPGLLYTMAVLMLGTGFLSNRRQISGLRVLIAVSALIWLIGCGAGGNGSMSSQTMPGTPAGSYTVTVTAATGSTSHSTALTLVVQ